MILRKIQFRYLFKVSLLHYFLLLLFYFCHECLWVHRHTKQIGIIWVNRWTFVTIFFAHEFLLQIFYLTVFAIPFFNLFLLLWPKLLVLFVNRGIFGYITIKMSRIYHAWVQKLFLLLCHEVNWETFLLLLIRVFFKGFVYSLFYHAHVNEHIRFRYPLSSKKFLIIIELIHIIFDFKNICHLWNLNLHLCNFFVIFFFDFLHFIYIFPCFNKFYFKLLDCLSFVRIVPTFLKVSIDFTLHFEYLGFKVLYLRVELIYKFEQCKVLFFTLNELFDK